MRLTAFILALCVCVYHTRAASINVLEKKLDDLDNVDLDNVDTSSSDHEHLVQETQNKLKTTDGDIPVKIIEQSVLNENSNDYIPADDNHDVDVKRIEIDLNNPGLPQKQQHETQNPENFGDNEKTIYAIKHTIETAENVFKEGLQSVSNSFKTFYSAEEDIPLIQKNIKNLKHTFTKEIENVDNTIKAYLKPQTSLSNEISEVNPNIAVVKSRLKFLEKNFQIGLDTLSEGIELYSIIKEEDEAEKAVALKANLKDDSDTSEKPSSSSPSSTTQSSTTASTGLPQMPWNQYLQNLQNYVSTGLNNLTIAISNTFNGNSNGNQQATAQQSNPVFNFFQGIGLTNWIPGQTTPTQTSTEKVQEATRPQSDELVTTTTSAPWGPQAFFQYVQNSFNGLVNPGQNNQQGEQVSQQPANNNGPIQQAFQNIVSFINPGQTTAAPQVQQPTNPNTPPEKAPTSGSNDKPDQSAQADNVVSDPLSQGFQQPQPAPTNSVPAPAQVGPIQQLVQNNPIIKGIQDAVQRIQGTPNPNAPREEIIQEVNHTKNDNTYKGHYYGGNRPNNNTNLTNQGDIDDSSRIEDKLEEVSSIPSEEITIAEEQITAEVMKTPSISEKTE